MEGMAIDIPCRCGFSEAVGARVLGGGSGAGGGGGVSALQVVARLRPLRVQLEERERRPPPCCQHAG